MKRHMESERTGRELSKAASVHALWMCWRDLEKVQHDATMTHNTSNKCWRVFLPGTDINEGGPYVTHMPPISFNMQSVCGYLTQSCFFYLFIYSTTAENKVIQLLNIVKLFSIIKYYLILY